MDETLRGVRAISAGALLAAWDYGWDRHPVDRALLLLALACPQVAPEALGTLTVGQRNARLLALRRMTLGANAECLVECPACRTPLEFTVDLPALLEPEPASVTGQVVAANWRLDYRLPTSLDLAALAREADLSTARRRLIERCIVRAECVGEAEATDVPEEAIGVLAQAMLEQDPQAEMEFKLSCSTCEHCWTAIFDIAAFFWEEIEAQARRLLHEVHLLATAYGWRESEILALSPLRRQFYLELVR